MTTKITIAATFLLTAAGAFAAGFTLSGCVAPTGDPGAEGAEALLSWESFRAQAEQRADGVFVIDGDLPVQDEAELREIYDLRLEAHLAGLEGEAVAAQEELLLTRLRGGAEARWSEADRRDLRYCVRGFGGEETAQSFEDLLARIDREELLFAVEGAAADWERVANVRFRRVERCEEALFAIAPADDGASYIASAFFPNYPTDKRVLSVARAWLPTGARHAELGARTLRGLMRHQLGHVLGFRHVHAGLEGCDEAAETEIEAEIEAGREPSVMRSTECAGLEQGDLGISTEDAIRAATAYGVPIPG